MAIADKQDGVTLESLARQHGSDKADHGYCDFYEDLLTTRRMMPLKVLELGVGGFERQDDPSFGGASLRMWRDYLLGAQIVSVDILDKHLVAEDRITVVQGSQVDRALLTRLSSEHGPFDFIVDDASHIPALTIESFEILFPLLADGGIYVIEDLSTSYWPTWGGRFRRRATGSTVGYLKDRLDGLNHAEWKLPNVVPSDLDTSIIEVRARHNIVALFKGDNRIASDLNRPQPVTYAQWLSGDVVPYLTRAAHHPSILRVLDAIGLRSLASRARRRLVKDMSR